MSPLHVVLAVLVTIAGEEKPAERVDVASLEPGTVERIAEAVKKAGVSPTDYLARKFEKHDVVFLGETHWVKENCDLVSGSLATLYREAGVRRLATEFVPSRFNDRLEAIVIAPEYDEAAVVAIFREGPWPIWGFREYADTIEAAWKLNRSLPDGAEPLLVIGLDSDWSQFALWFEIKDRMKQFEVRLARERHMVSVLDEQAFAKNLKTLVHVGAAHAITCHGERLGTVLYRKYGDRMFQVHLHSNISAGRATGALTKVMEAVFEKAGGKPMGLDVGGSPLDDLYDPKAIWWRMLPDARISTFAQGYVFLAPLDGQHRVSWIDGFVTDELFEKARAVCERCGWAEKGACKTPAELNAVLKKRFAGGRIADD